MLGHGHALGERPIEVHSDDPHVHAVVSIAVAAQEAVATRHVVSQATLSPGLTVETLSRRR